MTNETPVQTLGGHISTFCLAYLRQEEAGRADAIGSWQFSHTLADWLRSDHPEPIDEWIAQKCKLMTDHYE